MKNLTRTASAIPMRHHGIIISRIANGYLVTLPKDEGYFDSNFHAGFEEIMKTAAGIADDPSLTAHKEMNTPPKPPAALIDTDATVFMFDNYAEVLTFLTERFKSEVIQSEEYDTVLEEWKNDNG